MQNRLYFALGSELPDTTVITVAHQAPARRYDVVWRPVASGDTFAEGGKMARLVGS
jgi:hypothetical protein